ncbi:hypothetical protein L1049_000917 [Liquidambar formosana]|uniref:Uncharacterized protein n=1 Tax=Liquidambar formosana TaxID=63359 RepID=A0AAP0N9M5_LIQFO
MEDSMNSMSNNQALSSKARPADSPEESGWTMYFEDFLSNNNGNHGSFSSGHEISSLVSDAASSSVAKKVTQNEKAYGFTWGKRCKNLSFKKRKTKGVLVDDALEDTASSPVNSPKICNLDQLDMNPKERDNKDTSQKGGTSGDTDQRSELGSIGRDSDSTKLKKKGLCLVPLSMLTNYLG